MLGALAKQGRAKEALEVSECVSARGQGQNTSPLPLISTNAASTLFHFHPVPLQTLDAMKAAGARPDVYCYNNAILACYRHHQNIGPEEGRGEAGAASSGLAMAVRLFAEMAENVRSFVGGAVAVCDG